MAMAFEGFDKVLAHRVAPSSVIHYPNAYAKEEAKPQFSKLRFIAYIALAALCFIGAGFAFVAQQHWLAGGLAFAGVTLVGAAIEHHSGKISSCLEKCIPREPEYYE
jgi:hypothetical protein